MATATNLECTILGLLSLEHVHVLSVEHIALMSCSTQSRFVTLHAVFTKLCITTLIFQFSSWLIQAMREIDFDMMRVPLKELV